MPLGVLPVLSATSEHDLEVHLYVQADTPSVAGACMYLSGAEKHVRCHGYEFARSLAATWNAGLIRAFDGGRDVVLIANDDIVFTPGDVDAIAETAAANADRFLVSCAGRELRGGQRTWTHGYSCFALNPIALEHVGCFDENFFPAWWEDCDYHRRAALLGLRDVHVETTDVLHLGGGSRLAATASGTIFAGDRNAEYYRRKWGGMPPHEQFARPFDDASVDLRIAPERRERPYGEHDRADGYARVR